MSFFKKYYKNINIQRPHYHFVLGSGFSDLLNQVKSCDFFQNWEEKESCPFTDVPGVAAPSVDSHKGVYRFFVHKTSSLSVCLQCGRLHLYEGHSAEQAVSPVLQIRQAGTEYFILSNISGSLKKEHSPGTVIALKDHVNMTGQSPLLGPEKIDEKGQKTGPRFPEMTEIYDSNLRERISSELLNAGVRVNAGVYVAVLGPELESPAQIEWLNRSSGSLFDVVGMSTALEAVALKHSGAKVGGFSLVSNFAAGLEPQSKELSFEEMQKNIAPSALKILQAFFLFSEKQFLKHKL